MNPTVYRICYLYFHLVILPVKGARTIFQIAPHTNIWYHSIMCFGGCKHMLIFYMHGGTFKNKCATMGICKRKHVFVGCWKMQDFSVLHLWWACSKVRHFWIRTYNFIYSLPQVNLPKIPLQALLGKPGHVRHLIAIIFTAA